MPHTSSILIDEPENAKRDQAQLRQVFLDPPHQVSPGLMNAADFNVLSPTARLHNILEKGTQPKFHTEKAEYPLSLVIFHGCYSGMIRACDDAHGEIRHVLRGIGYGDSKNTGFLRVVRDRTSCLAKVSNTHDSSKEAAKSTTEEHTIDGTVKHLNYLQLSKYDKNGIKHAEKANGRPASHNRQY